MALPGERAPAGKQQHGPGGTLTSVKVGSSVFKVTSGVFCLPAGKEITPTYTAPGGWVWF